MFIEQLLMNMFEVCHIPTICDNELVTIDVCHFLKM